MSLHYIVYDLTDTGRYGQRKVNTNTFTYIKIEKNWKTLKKNTENNNTQTSSYTHINTKAQTKIQQYLHTNIEIVTN